MSSIIDRETRVYTEILTAAIGGDDEAVRRRLETLDQSRLSRLRNVLHEIGELAEAERKRKWRASR